MHQPPLEQLKTLASDKLINIFFQSTPDLILRWLDDLPAVVLEAQMAPDPGLDR